MSSLADALAIVAPALPQVFFDEARLAALDGWARTAPPVAWAGFECPLGGGERWVDFHQGFRRQELPYLLGWLEHRARTEHGEAEWTESLLEFCREWGREDSLFGKAIPNLIFEYDVRDHPERISHPSVFLALTDDDRIEHFEDDPTTQASKAAVIDAALKLFMEPAIVGTLSRGIARCLQCAPGNATLSHLGLMLARNTRAVRINVRGLHFDQFLPYLDAIGWKGSSAGIEDLLAGLFALTQRLNLCIDVGSEIGIPIGLECATHNRDQNRWDKILGRLGENGICTDAQRRDLRNWWSQVSPVSPPAPWPANLLVAGLLESADRLPVIERYLSHLKVTWAAGTPLQFKSYLGFTHHFIAKPRKWAPPAKRPRIPLRSEVASTADDLDRAISGAIDYLLHNRLASGLWHDFPPAGFDDPWLIYFGASDEWVSAFVAAAIAPFERDDARGAARWVWQVINHRRRRGEGYGFSLVTPADADSTAWALKLAQVLGESASPHAIGARKFLMQHQLASGGVATYLPEASIRLFKSDNSSVSNPWCEAHACVTAAAANLPAPSPECLRFLRASQQEDGRWVGFWWMDSEYATGLAAAALARSKDAGDRARIDAAIRWCSDRINDDGGVFSAACDGPSPFATAWSLRALLAAPDHAHARALALREVQWLIKQQRPDGSWHPSAWLKSPPIDVNDRDGYPKSILALDRYANFTTAGVLAALGLARGIYQSH